LGGVRGNPEHLNRVRVSVFFFDDLYPDSSQSVRELCSLRHKVFRYTPPRRLGRLPIKARLRMKTGIADKAMLIALRPTAYKKDRRASDLFSIFGWNQVDLQLH
jgi:hypothetical protein